MNLKIAALKSAFLPQFDKTMVSIKEVAEKEESKT